MAPARAAPCRSSLRRADASRTALWMPPSDPRAMLGEIQRRARPRHLAHEVVARDVIARVEAEEVEPHALELFLPIALERLLGFVRGAPAILRLQQRGEGVSGRSEEH